MPFALAPDQRAYRAEIAGRMKEAKKALRKANREATAFARDIADTAQAEIDRRSDRWRASRAGRRAQAWTDRWRDFRAPNTDTAALEAFNALPDSAE